MFNFDKFQNLVLGSFVTITLVGCQSSGSELYEELVQQDLSLGQFLEEQDGSLEEWEDKEKRVAMKIERGEYELSEQGLLADESGGQLDDPMAGAFGDWGDAPEDIADAETDSSLSSDEDLTAIAIEASKKVRLGKLAAGKGSTQEQAPDLTGADAVADETSLSKEKDAAGQPHAAIGDPGRAGEASAEPSSISEDEDYHRRDLSEDDSLAMLLGGDVPAPPSEHTEDGGQQWGDDLSNTVTTGNEEFGDDAFSDGSVVSQGVFVTIREPARFASQEKGDTGWLEERSDEQDTFLASLVGDERDAEAWDEAVPQKEPGFDIEDLQLMAFDLPVKMNVDLEDMAAAAMVHVESLQLAFADAKSIEVAVDTPNQPRVAQFVASLDSPYRGLAASGTTIGVDVDFDGFLGEEIASLAERDVLGVPEVSLANLDAPKSAAKPIQAKKMRAAVVAQVKKTPVVAQVKKVPVVAQVKKVPVVAQVKKVPVVAQVKKAPVVLRVARVKTAPVVAQVKKAPVIARIAQVGAGNTVILATKPASLPQRTYPLGRLFTQSSAATMAVLVSPIRRYPFKEQEDDGEPMYWHDRRMKVWLQKRIRIEACYRGPLQARV